MKRLKNHPILWMAVLCLGILGAQEGSGYLAQKLMVENDLRARITDALTKVIDEKKYVVDVSVELELTRSVEEQFTIITGEENSSPAPNRLGAIAEDIEAESNTSSQSISGVGLPIPGFDFEVDPEPSAPIADNVEEEYEVIEQKPADKQHQSRTHIETRPSVASVKEMDISIILQEGASPELIENIRQVVMIAARFNRARGDVLSIMTASFKERRDEKTAEHILLKNIAEKLESLEEQNASDSENEETWQSELDRYKENEAQRREEDRLYFQSKLAELEMAARSRAYENEKTDILQDDSIKIQSLNDEIQELRKIVSATPDSGLQAQMSLKEGEKEKLDNQIAEKMNMLESIQSDLDRKSGGGSTMMVVFMSILGALVIVLVVVLVMVLMGNKNKQQAFPPPPPWMYPPRSRKKKDDTVNGESNKTVIPTTESQPKAVQAVEDPSVTQSEINDMKQAVVSMSVGQPSTATKIVQDWIVTEAPAPLEPEVVQPEESSEEEDGGKKKKKKKKK